jgi:hypothetical protein
MGSAMTTTGTGLLLSILLKCQLILVDQKESAGLSNA